MYGNIPTYIYTSTHFIVQVRIYRVNHKQLKNLKNSYIKLSNISELLCRYIYIIPYAYNNIDNRTLQNRLHRINHMLINHKGFI